MALASNSRLITLSQTETRFVVIPLFSVRGGPTLEFAFVFVWVWVVCGGGLRWVDLSEHVGLCMCVSVDEWICACMWG